MRPIDADTLERMGYVLTRTYKQDKKTMVYETKKLSDVPSVELDKKGRWIPCSERLPLAEYGESDTVLATCGYGDVEDTSIRWIRMLYFNGGTWCYPTGETYEQKVYAWMPLPEPYGGEDK